MNKSTPLRYLHCILGAFLFLFAVLPAEGQKPASAMAELGSNTAKNGFKNEDEIRDKFNAWKTDADARAWLAAMNYKPVEIESLTATKPHGEKADVEVRIKTKRGETVEGISIKLVSSPNGFNQIDKRWLSHYVTMWKIPADVEAALKLFVGEIPPTKAGRSADRMYLDELDPAAQKAVIDFFSKHKDDIVSDLFAGDGIHAAEWVMVAFKATENTRWAIHSSADTIKFFGEGPVELTRNGNLKIGRITVQRKGGDGGRDTAKMLQFKINPALLMDATPK
jgi:R.HinP1I restriction endonuclease